MRIAVDTIGGDNGSKVIVEAIINFLSKHKDVEIVAVGNQDELKELEGKCEIIHATLQILFLWKLDLLKR